MPHYITLPSPLLLAAIIYVIYSCEGLRQGYILFCDWSFCKYLVGSLAPGLDSLAHRNIYKSEIICGITLPFTMTFSHFCSDAQSTYARVINHHLYRTPRSLHPCTPAPVWSLWFHMPGPGFWFWVPEVSISWFQSDPVRELLESPGSSLVQST